MAIKIWDGGAADNAFSSAANYNTDSAPATGGDHDISGSDESATLLSKIIVEPGNTCKYGSRLTYLHVDTDDFEYAGTGASFWQIDNATGIIRISAADTGGDTDNSYGFNLIGSSGSGTVIVETSASQTVGIAALGGETATFSAIVVVSGTVTLGSGLTLTTLYQQGGTIYNYADVTTVHCQGGAMYQKANNPTTLNIWSGGAFYWQSTDAIDTVNLYYGGTLYGTLDSRPKIITTLNHYGGVLVNTDGSITVTNFNDQRGTYTQSN